MKTAYQNVVTFITGIILLVACKPNTVATGKPVPPVIDNVTSTLYPAAEAQGDIAYFDTLCSKFISSALHDSSVNYANVPIRAFTIRAVDLFAAMGMKVQDSVKFEHIRVYLGYSKEANQFKLFILPVQNANIVDSNAGSDVLLDSTGNYLPPSDKFPLPPGFLINKYVLDLNAPCPNLCDTRTPLILQ